MGNKSRLKKEWYCRMSKSIIIITLIWFLNRKKKTIFTSKTVRLTPLGTKTYRSVVRIRPWGGLTPPPVRVRLCPLPSLIRTNTKEIRFTCVPTLGNLPSAVFPRPASCYVPGRPSSFRSRLQVSYSTKRTFKRSVIGSEGWNHHDHASITINHEWNESYFFVVSFSAKSRLLCGHYNYIHPKL